MAGIDTGRLAEAMEYPMQAVVMAGGLGTRLRPVTNVLPKLLVPVGPRPLLDYALDAIADAGIARVHLMLGHHAGLIQAYVDAHHTRWLSLDIAAHVEREPMGTAGPLRLLKNVAGHLLVLNGDVVCDAALRSVVDGHLSSGADCTVVTVAHEVQVPFAVVAADRDDRLLRLDEKPTYRYPVAAGMYVLSPRCRELVRPIGCDDMPDLIDRALERGLSVRQFRLDPAATWCEVGEPVGYAHAQRVLAAVGQRDVA